MSTRGPCVTNLKKIKMIWGPLILVIAGSFAAGTAYYLHQLTDRVKFLGLMLAAVCFVAVEAAVISRMLIDNQISYLITHQIIEWGHIYALALTLSSLLLFVRESKPEFSQFPILYATLPFITIVSYLLVYDTVMLKDWLLSIYQGGAVIVAVLIYGIYSYRNAVYRTQAIGAILFFSSFLASLIFFGYPLIWQLLLAAGIITTFSGYLVVEKYFA